MPTIMSSDIIREVRRRKQLSRKQVHVQVELSSETKALANLTIMRAEKGEQTPTKDNLDKLLGVLEIPSNTYFCPVLDNLTTEMLKMNSRIEFCALRCSDDEGYLKQGFDLLEQMRKSGSYSKGVNLQFLLSYEVIFKNASMAAPKFVRDIAIRGIRLTYPEFVLSKYSGEVLVFEEAPLLHGIAVSYLNEGLLKEATTLIKNILTGLILLPKDDREKERMLSPILLTLAKCHMEEGDYKNAVDVCNTGLEITIKRNRGYHAPDFARIKALCCLHLGKKDESASLYIQAYAGFSLLRKHNTAKSLLIESLDVLGYELNTYGMETLIQPMPVPDFNFGSIAPCKSIGQLFGFLRNEADISLKSISEGICSESNLSRIESGDLEGNYYHLEALMERYGRHIGNYFYTFMGKEDFEEKQLRDEVKSLLGHRKYDELPALLENLASRKQFQKGVNLQFIELAKASMGRHKSGIGGDYLKKIKQIMAITRKSFNLNKVADTRFTHAEYVLLNMMGIAMCETGDTEGGLKLYGDTVINMAKYLKDNNEKSRIHSLITRNYAHYLERSDRLPEALYHTQVSANFDLINGSLAKLSFHADNLACCMLKQGEKERSIPYFAQAYYGSLLVGDIRGASATLAYVNNELGFCFLNLHLSHQ